MRSWCFKVSKNDVNNYILKLVKTSAYPWLMQVLQEKKTKLII